MAGQFGFTSPGAGANDAISQFLMQREMQNRQRMLDELLRQNQTHDNQAQDAQLLLQRDQENRVAEAQSRQQSDLEQEREFRRAGTIAENALPDDPVDDPTRELLGRQGFGGQVRQVPGILVQGPMQEGQGRPSSPESFAMRGGSKYLNAEAQRESTAALAGQAEAGRNERAEADRETRALLAQIAASGRADSSDLRNKLLEVQTALAQDKLDAGRTERDKNEKATSTSAQNALSLLDRLEQHGGFDTAYGNVSSRFAGFNQDATDAGAIRDQVVAALTLPNLGTLKGPASDKDILFLKQLATRMQNPRISETEAKQAIAEARAVLQGGAASSGAATTGGSSFRVVGKR